MKSFRNLLAGAAALLLTAAAFAGDPTGTWKWSQPGRQGGAAIEQTLKLELKDGQLTGTLLGTQTPMGQIPDAAIGDASFKDESVAFSVTREFNGNKVTVKYTGQLDGDTIKGSTERPGRDGNVVKRDWTATRAK